MLSSSTLLSSYIMAEGSEPIAVTLTEGDIPGVKLSELVGMAHQSLTAENHSNLPFKILSVMPGKIDATSLIEE